MLRISVLAAATAATMATSLAFAQASAPTSRAQVKEETRGAAKAHQLTPPGQGGAPVTKSTAGPSTTREERKAATLQARKEGSLAPAGEAQTQKADAAASKQKSTRSRAERKAETVEARKKGELVPAGEGSPKKP